MSVARTCTPLLLVTALLCGCPQSTDPATFTKNYAAYLNRVADKLQTVNDPASATAAAAELEKLLAENESLQTQASQLAKDGDVPDDVKSAMSAASERVKQQIGRVQEDGLITPELEQALTRLKSANELTVAYAQAGALPTPETPLEQAYVDYIQVMEDLASTEAMVRDLASAQAALGKFQELGRRRNDALRRIAEHGGEQPPFGIPKKYADHMRAAQQRAAQADEALARLPEIDAITELLFPVLAVSEDVEKAFQTSSGIRQAGAANIVTVTLQNNRTLAGPRHQRMTRMIQEAAAGAQVEAQIDDDGTYRLIIAPVSDMRAFIRQLDLGQVSDINLEERTFVLTIDPARVPEESESITGPGMAPGFRGPGFPGGPGGRPAPTESSTPGGNSSGVLTELDRQKIEQVRDLLRGQEGAQNLIEVHLQNARAIQGPRMAKVLGVITRSTGARMLRPVPLQSGDGYFFFRSDRPVKEFADALELGSVEAIDENGRKLIVTLDPNQVPE